MSEPVRVIDRLSEWVAQGIRENSLGEDNVHWDVFVNVQADAQGNPFVVYAINISIPGAILGQRIAALAQVPFDHALSSREDLVESLRTMIENLKEQRSQSLREGISLVGSNGVPG